MTKKKVFLYLFVILVTLISLNIQLENRIVSKDKSMMKRVEYYPFRNIPEETYQGK